MPIFATAASADDSIQIISSGTATITADGQTAGDHDISSANHVGFRFPNVTIAQGTVIQNAYLYFDSLHNYTGFGNITGVLLHGEASDNAAQFTTTTNDIPNRARTAANLSGLSADQFGWTATSSTDVTSIVQEILNRAGWVSGNAMAMLFIGNGSAASGIIRPYQWDYFSGLYRARLEINRSRSMPKRRRTMQAVRRSNFY
jgi:hypothetical protein